MINSVRSELAVVQSPETDEVASLRNQLAGLRNQLEKERAGMARNQERFRNIGLDIAAQFAIAAESWQAYQQASNRFEAELRRLCKHIENARDVCVWTN